MNPSSNNARPFNISKSSLKFKEEEIINSRRNFINFHHHLRQLFFVFNIGSKLLVNRPQFHRLHYRVAIHVDALDELQNLFIRLTVVMHVWCQFLIGVTLYEHTRGKRTELARAQSP